MIIELNLPETEALMLEVFTADDFGLVLAALLAPLSGLLGDEDASPDLPMVECRIDLGFFVLTDDCF